MIAFANIRASALIVFIAVVWAGKGGAEKPLIDFQTSEYFLTEQELWAKINSDEHPSSLYESVVAAHKRFIEFLFVVSSNNLAIYEPTGILVDNLRNVNELFFEVSSLILNTKSIESIDIYKVRDIVRDSDAYSNHIFREANRPEFWENGKDVSQFNRINYTTMIWMNLDLVVFLFSSTQNIAVNPKNHRQR